MKLQSSAFCMVVMPTLRRPVRKKGSANTKAAAISIARRALGRPTKKKVVFKTAKSRAPSRASRANNGVRQGNDRTSRIFEDANDLALIRRARAANRGKKRYSVNEIRELRKLAAL